MSDIMSTGPHFSRPPRSASRPGDRAKGAASPVNIRIRIPFPFKSLYLTILAVPERRSAERLRIERQSSPLRTAANLAFAIATAIAFYLAAAVLLLYSSVVEF